jgi:hypothetical protein
LQRRAAFRLAAMARSAHPPKEPTQPGTGTEIAAPVVATLATSDADTRSTGPLAALAIPPELASAEPLPIAPLLPLGKKLAAAIKRLDMIKTQLDLLEEPGQ